MQRAILTSLVVTFLASLLMIPVALGPIGYSPGRATLEILVYGSVLVLLFILLSSTISTWIPTVRRLGISSGKRLPLPPLRTATASRRSAKSSCP